MSTAGEQIEITIDPDWVVKLKNKLKETEQEDWRTDHLQSLTTLARDRSKGIRANDRLARPLPPSQVLPESHGPPKMVLSQQIPCSKPRKAPGRLGQVDRGQRAASTDGLLRRSGDE
ncbi:unnamed protein product [Musa textilis]